MTTGRDGGAGTRDDGRAPELERTLGLGLLVLYGLGVTVGAGIYVLVGAAATRAGSNAPVAFLVAAVVMALSAASFAELATRFPVAAGEAAYVQAGFGSRLLALLVGLLVVATCVVSSAAISRGAAGYLGSLVPADGRLLVTLIILTVGVVAAWGIAEAVGAAAIMTLIEIGGLVAIVAIGLWDDPGVVDELWRATDGLGTAAAWRGILGASLIAFFAFIGFESMVNVVEEVKAPERTLPLAIAITLAVSTLIYILVVAVVLRAVPHEELARSAAPLSLAYERITGASPLVITLIAIFATVNGVIVQMLMASRVLYGLGRQGALPRVLGRVSARTHTPLLATALVVAPTLALAVSLPVDRLADLTTQAMLVVFGLVNAALVALKLRRRAPPARIDLPVALPLLGMLSCIGLLVASVAA